MAKKTPPTKSQAVRDYDAVNPNASRSQVFAALKKQGIEITEAVVSTIRSRGKGAS